jgi:hypothetical protein
MNQPLSQTLRKSLEVHMLLQTVYLNDKAALMMFHRAQSTQLKNISINVKC